MAKQPASLSSLVKRQPSWADAVEKPKQCVPKQASKPIVEPVVERDVGPPRRLSFSCPPWASST